MKSTVLRHELVRYVVNGVLATLVHYGVLNLNTQVLGFSSVGLANGVASIFGITASYLGNRHFVFRTSQPAPLVNQFSRFAALYAAIALLHTGVMWLWADHLRWNYHVGFLVATGVQFASSFVGNKLLVFKHET